MQWRGKYIILLSVLGQHLLIVITDVGFLYGTIDLKILF